MPNENETERELSVELTDGEREAVERSTFSATIDNIVKEEREKWDAEAAEELKKYTAPQPGRTISDPEKKVELLDRNKSEVHRLMSPTEPLYRQMSDNEREWRTPESDHWGAEWFRGHWRKDQARMARAIAGMEGVFGRALMTEGDAAGTGGVSDGTAAELLPRPVEAVILLARDAVAKGRRFFSQINMTRQTHTIPTAAAMAGYMTAEGVTATDGSPAIAHVELSAKKLQVTSLQTVELMADSAINIMSLLAQRGGAIIGTTEDIQMFKAGDGTPPNISAFLAGTGHTITAGDLNFSDLLAMYYAVNQVYRGNAVWLVEATVLQALAGLMNTSSGQQFYMGLADKPGPITDDATAEGTILRRPVYEVPLTAGTIWFGDPRAASVMGTRAGITSSMSEHVKFDVDQIMWKMTQRFDGINTDTVAGQQAVGVTGATI